MARFNLLSKYQIDKLIYQQRSRIHFQTFICRSHNSLLHDHVIPVPQAIYYHRLIIGICTFCLHFFEHFNETKALSIIRAF